MNKKLVVLSLAALLGLTACGEQPNDSKPNPSTSSQEQNQESSKNDNEGTNDSSETEDNNDSSDNSETEDNGEQGGETEEVLKNFEGLTLNNLEATYSGMKVSLKVGNLPEGATVVYTNNDKTEVGEYTVTAVVSKEGYNDQTLTGKIKILPADFKGISFESESIEFDSNPHTVAIVGALPEGATVTYKCLEDPSITNTVTNPGKYTITATIKCKNYNETTLTAEINVVSKDVERFITTHNGKVYFQNALDKDRLYTYDSTDGVTKVNNNKAQYFTEYKNELYYRSDSLAPSIVSLKANNTTSTICTDNAEYIIDDEQYIYYADNSLIGDNGIYRVKFGTDEITTERLYDGKAYYLQLVGNNIYFADGKNKKKLSRISKNIPNQTIASVVVDKKINNLITNGTNLFYTVNETLGDYISKYVVSSGTEVKLTSDAGKYLTLNGNDLYYVNADKLNSEVFGKGVYRVSTTGTSDSSKPGKLAIKADYKDFPISSLTYKDGSLYFYQTFDKKLYSYNLSTEVLTDTLKDFVVPEETNILSQKGAVTTVDNKIYYQNQYDGNALYAYDAVKGSNVKVTSTAVDDLYIYQDYIYYRQVSYLVNKDLYRINIKDGGEPELISKEDCGELEIANDKIYYTNYSGKNEIHMMDLDGTNDVIILNKNAYNLRVYNNRLYYIVNNGIKSTGSIYYIDLTSKDMTPVELDKCNTSYFEINNDKIYYRAVSGFSKNLSCVDLNGTNVEVLYDVNCDPNNFVIVGDVVYYNNDVTKQYGVESYNLKTKEHKVIKKDIYAYSLQYVNGDLYYQSYCMGGALGDGHFYKLSLDGTQTRIA